jgi:thioredoxin reductase (NADPH)
LEGISFRVSKATEAGKMEEVYDLAILGGGPAGLTAAIYASRGKMKTLVIEKVAIGGEAASTSLIENYPGFPEGISGVDLADRMHAQAKKFGTQVVFATPQDLDLTNQPKELTVEGRRIQAKSVLIASGTSPKPLDIPGEKEFKGKGVSYCATCDAPIFKGKDIAIIGCGNSGLQEGLFIHKFVKSLTMVEFLPTIQAEKILQENIQAHKNVRWLLNHEILSINGEQWVSSITVRERSTQEVKEVPVEGVFIYVGLKPNTDYLDDQVGLNELGFIPTDQRMQTSVPGVFAAGDVRVTEMRQVATAIGDGAMAAATAQHFIESIVRERV